MDWFNFQMILCYAMIALVTYTLWSYVKNRRVMKEEDVVVSGLTGFRYADTMQIFFIVLFLVLIIMPAFSMDFSTPEAKTYIKFYAAFGVVIAIYTLTFIIQSTSRKGFYKDGVIASTQILPYESITRFEIVKDVKKNALRIYFNQGKSMLGASMCVYITSDKEQQVRALLKKNCKLKKK